MIGIAALFIAGLFAILPSIVSAELIRSRLAYEISAWTGYEVELHQAPQLSFFPIFRAALNDVTISQPGLDDAPPLMTADRIEVNLSLFSVLTGDVSFSDTKLIRPHFLLGETPADLKAVEATLMNNTGRIGNVVRATRRAIDKKPADPDLSNVESQPFGRITFEGGTIIYKRPGATGEKQITKLNGTFNWPQTSVAASFQGSAVWAGETIEVDTTTDSPLLLIAGGTSPLRLKLTSAPMALTYNGTVNLSGDLFFQGDFSAKSPELGKALHWVGADSRPGDAIGSFSLEAAATATRKRVKLDNLSISVNDSPANGILEIGFEKEMPSITGTLAFNSLDLHSFLAAFTPLPDDANSQAVIDTSFLKQIDLDLRLSAKTATAGKIKLANVGATAQVKGGRADFDIGDATAFNGSVEAGFSLVQTEEQTTSELRLTGIDVDSAALFPALGLGQRFALGKGTVSLMLKGPGQQWSSLYNTGKGTFSMRFGPGQINNFDVADFISKASTNRFFELGSKKDSTLSFDTLEAKAAIAEGVATLETVKMQTSQGNLTLTGIVPFISQGLALTGDLLLPKAESAPEGAPERHIRFFVGGSWERPFVSPIFSEQQPEPNSAVPN
ncbi:MAG: AsmA family protein [Phyllobacterium sp.]